MSASWLALTAEPISVPTARKAVRERCQDCGADGMACDAAVLLVSELVTNAVLHARTPMALLVEQRDTQLYVAVRDWSTAFPKARRYNIDNATGRGLRLLEAMASAWGVQKVIESEQPGKIVWFELPLLTAEAAEDPDLASAFADVLQVE